MAVTSEANAAIDGGSTLIMDAWQKLRIAGNIIPASDDATTAFNFGADGDSGHHNRHRRNSQPYGRINVRRHIRIRHH